MVGHAAMPPHQGRSGNQLRLLINMTGYVVQLGRDGGLRQSGMQQLGYKAFFVLNVTGQPWSLVWIHSKGLISPQSESLNAVRLCTPTNGTGDSPIPNCTCTYYNILLFRPQKTNHDRCSVQTPASMAQSP